MVKHIAGPNRFDSFDIYQTFYKKIQCHEIEVGILIPQGLKPGLHPVFLKFHGGGCVSSIARYRAGYSRISAFDRSQARGLTPTGSPTGLFRSFIGIMP